MALATVVLTVAAFALAVAFDAVMLEDLPYIGPRAAANPLRAAGVLVGVIVVVWMARAFASRRQATAEADEVVAPVMPHDRANLLDLLKTRYADLHEDLLQYEVGERLARSSGETHQRIQVPLAVQKKADEVLEPTLRRRTPKATAPAERVTSLTDFHGEAGGRLLILGAPGAGKSTFLLGLARDLIDQARTDDKQTVPVIVNLAAWGDDGRPLADWLEGRLPDVLSISPGFARSLVRTRTLHLLLDGLDEVEATQRGACIQAVNAYLGDGPGKVVVCCRSQEYRDVQDTLHLAEAVEVQPLDMDDVVRDLDAFPGAAEIQDALRSDATLREMTTTPLLLSVVLLTYLHSPLRSFEGLPVERRMPTLWDDYLVEMLARRPRLDTTRDPEYAPADTLRWLSWLAGKMKADDMTDFLLDRMQPEWLGSPRLYRRLVFLADGLVVGLAYGLFFGLAIGPLFGICSGVAIGLLGGIRLEERITLVEVMTWNSQAARDGLLRGWKSLRYGSPVFGFGFGLSGGLAGYLIDGPFLGLAAWIVSGLAFWLLWGPITGLLVGGFDITKMYRARRPGERLRQTLLNGLVMWSASGLAFGVVSGSAGWVFFGPAYGLGLGLTAGILAGGISALRGPTAGAFQHSMLRVLLVREGHLPWRTEAFLLHAADLLLLQRDRDLVRFRHLLLRDHLASAAMTPAHIAGLAAQVEHERSAPSPG